MSVRPHVRTSVHTYVRTSTIKLNAATNQIVVGLLRSMRHSRRYDLQGHPRSRSRSIRRWPQSPIGTIFKGCKQWL